MTYSDPPYSDPPYSAASGDGVAGAITPAPIASATVVPGPVGLGAAVDAIRPAPVPSSTVVPGPRPVPNPLTLRPITPRSITSATIVPGPWIPLLPGLDPPGEGDPEGPYHLSVVDFEHATNKQASPALNDMGSAGFTVPRDERPDPGDVIGFEVGGHRIFTGIASQVEDVRLDPGREVAQVATTTVVGFLDDWRRCVVLPDFGAQDTSRLGSPVQDARVFDWSMNGGQGELGSQLTPSLSIDAGYGTSSEVFPLPDVWPDARARWMWASSPRYNAPKGYCFFRVPFYAAAGRAQAWLCAHDYAELWIDGVQIATCEQPGVAQRIEIPFTAGFHLATIRAYNDGGKAGVLCSILPVNSSDGLYGEPWMNSRSNWKVLAYPSRSFRLNPGQIVKRLHVEAQRRGVDLVGDWELDFNEQRDSAGRPWPANAPVTLDVGMTYFDVLRRLSEDLVDFAASPSRRRLRMWVKDRGTGRDVDLPWTTGIDLTGRVVTKVLA